MITAIQKIKGINPKLYRFLIMLCVCVYVASIVPGIILLKGISLKKQLLLATENVAQYESFEKDKNVPSEQRLNYLSQQLNETQDIFKDIQETIAHTQSIESKNAVALDFKEALFSIKQRLQQKAQSLHIPFPEQYGMEQYETLLPDASELPELFFSLHLVETVLTALLDAKVISIESIKLYEYRKKNYAEKGAETYAILPCEINFNSSFASMVSFCEKLSSSPYLYIVENMRFSHATHEGHASEELENTLRIDIARFADQSQEAVSV